MTIDKENSVNKIRTKFIDYFNKNNHQIVSSRNLVPDNDPTLLFTNAGMVQLLQFMVFQCITKVKQHQSQWLNLAWVLTGMCVLHLQKQRFTDVQMQQLM